MKVISWTKISKKYKGLWVGLKQDEKTVVSSGKTLMEALNKAHKKKYPNPIMVRMPERFGTMIGTFL